ncbi:unnamed protein product [Arctogadus glacialis]
MSSNRRAGPDPGGTPSGAMGSRESAHTYGSDPNTVSMDPTTTSSDDLPYFQDDYVLALGNNTGNNRLRSGGMEGMEGMEMGPPGDICDSILAGAQVPLMCYCRFCKGGEGPKGDQASEVSQARRTPSVEPPHIPRCPRFCSPDPVGPVT